MQFTLVNQSIIVKRRLFVHWDNLESQPIEQSAERIYTFKSAEDAKRVYSLLVNDTIESYDVLHDLVWEENITCTDWILW